MNKFLHSWDAWAVAAFVVMVIVLLIITREGRGVIGKMAENIANDLKPIQFRDPELCVVEGCTNKRQFRFCGIWICNDHRKRIEIIGKYPADPQ